MAVYYVDQTTGDDANSGLTEALAWKTLNKLYISAFVPDDFILLKRGETWREKLRNDSSGTSGHQITYGAYGSGAKPKILGSKDLSGAGSWADEGSNIWVTAAVVVVDADVGNIIFNSEASVGVKRATLVACVNQGDFYYNSSTTYLRMYSVGNPGTFYTAIEAIVRDRGFDTRTLDYITVQNLDIRYCGLYGILASNGVGIIVEDNDISFIGGYYAAAPTRAGNGIEFWSSGSDSIVRRNRVSECYDAGLTFQGTAGTVVAQNQTWVYNQVWNCEYGFEYFEFGDGAVVDGITIAHNVFYGSGYGWGHAQHPSARGDGIAFQGMDYGAATNCKLGNNIVAHSLEAHFYMWYTTDLAGWTVDHNVYYDGPASPFEQRLAGPTYYTFTEWQATYAADAHSFVADPKYLNVATHDFRLRQDSPCRDRGVVVSGIGQIEGGGQPDIGCDEIISGAARRKHGYRR